MILQLDNKFNYFFCKNCGQYIYSESNKTYINILCLCDRRPQLFENYHNFINEIPDDYSGDELEDFMEEKSSTNEIQQTLVQYIHRMVLFGITYKKEYYNNIDDNITDKILDFLKT